MRWRSGLWGFAIERLAREEFKRAAHDGAFFREDSFVVADKVLLRVDVAVNVSFFVIITST